MNTSTISQEFGRRFDPFEEAIVAKLDHLAELHQPGVQGGPLNSSLGGDSVGTVPWIFLSVLLAVSAVCWLVARLAPVVR